ncbi:hypothetical protein LCGC14_1892080 [marine sediment metagenome]|uniref:Uncharacterized protein n=1 Tax=marine sediment metagenome TaxID=412755 RepID=A0A0F9GME3_9ZZZZ
MIKYTNIVPKAVKDEPEYIQQAYVREFHRVEEQTNDAHTAKSAADKLLLQLRHVLSKQGAKSKDSKVKLTQKLMEVKIHAHISELSVSDYLSPEILTAIKKTDPHPFLVVYDIGGEGVSSGRVDNKKERKIWSFHAIKELSRKIREGTVGVIHGHNIVGQDTRRKIGKVIHAFTKIIKNSLHALAIAYITDGNTIDKIKNGKFDICSIEGDVLLARESKDSTWFVKDIEKINNLAIGSSAVDNPGFSGAGVLATIQEMNKE